MFREKGGFEDPASVEGTASEREEHKEEVLWEGDDIFVRFPDRPAISPDDGSHIKIVPSGQGNHDWRTASVREVVHEGLYALPAARMLADSGRTSDLWANIHWNSLASDGANVFGRAPASEAGWAKPVVIQEKGADFPDSDSARENLKKFSERYFSKWSRLKEEGISLFSGGVRELDSDSSEFQKEVESYAEREHPWQETVLWVNEKFVLVSVDNPHLSGTHLVIHPRDEYWSKKGDFRKPWQTEEARSGDLSYIEGFLESLAILKSAQKVLSEQEDVPFMNSEIHYSGNWAGDLQSQERGGQLAEGEFAQALSESDPRISVRDQKRRYQRGRPEEFQTSMHGHLYATEDSGEFVHLPTRPKSEAPEEWQGISLADQGDVSKIQKVIQERLGAVLEREAKESIV
ncbi:hypothetical protein CL629_01390 [bacterium]|nr:hypothetical protein [bacterium]|tara:strand:+ start:6730 stop:7941 length:1212 start_codon:yes stop_codon:yes gene_type:complete